VSQVVALDRRVLTDHVGRVSSRQLEMLLDGIDVILDR
jgi:mRNA-degrading endonuclease toxin of MazEF toxin-antitoxin module